MIEVADQRGRGAPDEVRLPVDGKIQAVAATRQLRLVQLMQAGVHQYRQRHLEHVCHFGQIGCNREPGAYQPYHGLHRKAGRGKKAGLCADQLYEFRINADLFLRFAQRGRYGVSVARLDADTGEAYLARVIVKMRSPAGKQRMQAGRTLNQREEYGGLSDIGASIDVIAEGIRKNGFYLPRHRGLESGPYEVQLDAGGG